MLALQHPRVLGVSGDERWLAQELLLGDGPEVASGQQRGGGAGLQVVLPAEPPQPQQLTVAVQRVPAEGQGEGRGGQQAGRGQHLGVGGPKGVYKRHQGRRGTRGHTSGLRLLTPFSQEISSYVFYVKGIPH